MMQVHEANLEKKGSEGKEGKGIGITKGAQTFEALKKHQYPSQR
jgi:hypothetical protein